MSLTITYSQRAGSYSVDLGTSAVRLGKIALTQAAEHGDIASSSLEIDDLTGTAGHSSDQILPYHTIELAESRAPIANQIIWTGYTMDRTYESDDSLILGAAVRITVELADINHAAHDPVLRGTDANRSRESVGDRVAWLIASPYSFFLDLGLVVYPTTMMDATDYTNQTSDSVLDDLAEHVGYNWFLYKDETATPGAQTGLFFDNSNTSTAYTSTFRISNTLADVDSDTDRGDGATHTWAPIKPRLSRSPRTMASGIVLPYASSTVYVTRAATSAIIGHVDVTAADANVKTATSAALRANRLLWEASTEEDLITCSVDVPAANVNDIRAGQRMSAKFRQLPGYKSAFSWFRVLRRTVNSPGLTDAIYQIDLDLSPCEAAQPATGIVQSAFGVDQSGGEYLTLPNPVTLGNELWYMACERQNAVSAGPSVEVSQPNFGTGAWTRVGGTIAVSRTSDGYYPAGGLVLYHKTADSTSNVGFIQERYSVYGIWEMPAGTTAATVVSVNNHASGTSIALGSLGTPTTGQVALMILGIGADGDTVTVTPGTWVRDIYTNSFLWGSISGNTISGGAFPYVWIGHNISDGTALSASATLSTSQDYAGIAVLLS